MDQAMEEAPEEAPGGFLCRALRGDLERFLRRARSPGSAAICAERLGRGLERIERLWLAGCSRSGSGEDGQELEQLLAELQEAGALEEEPEAAQRGAAAGELVASVSELESLAPEVSVSASASSACSQLKRATLSPDRQPRRQDLPVDGSLSPLRSSSRQSPSRQACLSPVDPGRLISRAGSRSSSRPTGRSSGRNSARPGSRRQAREPPPLDGVPLSQACRARQWGALTVGQLGVSSYSDKQRSMMASMMRNQRCVPVRMARSVDEVLALVGEVDKSVLGMTSLSGPLPAMLGLAPGTGKETESLPRRALPPNRRPGSRDRGF
mmetsp:Transcript_20784/g.45773  ORF Transcript_20784/g.45773 Transcript_20784/m.45773 type:complete len:324 (-) Transcript_20784:31-1002(-)